MEKILSEYVAPTVVKELEQQISNALKKAGIYHRLFSRKKDPASVLEKIERKGYPTKDGKILQDIIGVRIALYFADDVEICRQIVESIFDSVGTEATKLNPTVFEPERLNIVCKLPDKFVNLFLPELWTEYPIDKTFEVQIRTVFSEGWHEIEHDIRYKSDSDWNEQADLSRNLNGILATLETCDWSILSIIDDLAYREYKKSQWAAMLKNKLRIHLADSALDAEIINIFDKSPNIAKNFYRLDRKSLLLFLACEMKQTVPLTLSNIVYITNLLWVKDYEIEKITPTLLKDIFERYKLLG